MIDAEDILKNAKGTLDDLQEAFDEGKIHQIFVVTMDASGTITTYVSGKAYNYAVAGVALQGRFIEKVL